MSKLPLHLVEKIVSMVLFLVLWVVLYKKFDIEIECVGVSKWGATAVPMENSLYLLFCNVQEF